MAADEPDDSAEARCQQIREMARTKPAGARGAASTRCTPPEIRVARVLVPRHGLLLALVDNEEADLS